MTRSVKLANSFFCLSFLHARFSMSFLSCVQPLTSACSESDQLVTLFIFSTSFGCANHHHSSLYTGSSLIRSDGSNRLLFNSDAQLRYSTPMSDSDIQLRDLECDLIHLINSTPPEGCRRREGWREPRPGFPPSCSLLFVYVTCTSPPAGFITEASCGVATPPLYVLYLT